MPKSEKGPNFLFCNHSAWIVLYIMRLYFQLIICQIKNKIGIHIADIAMLTCFTYFVKHSSYSRKTKFVKRAN